MRAEVARIIDANANRARETLRVMEDYARFVNDDRAGCEALKRFRHDLVACLRRCSTAELLAARDTPADVGTTVSTDSERHRSDARDVCLAAARRLPEALRTIEEYAKTADGELAAAVEVLRYRAYTLEQQLLLRGPRAGRFAAVRLYVIVTEVLCRRPWLETAGEAIAGGAGCIQLREKSLDDGELLERARQLANLCRHRGALCIINDRPDIARLADADGVHLGQTDMTPGDARRILGPDRLIGLSTHHPEQLDRALAIAPECGPDYVAVGPMFDSATKPQPLVAGPELLRHAASRTERPVVPIGGITTDNADILNKAGAERLCVCSAVISTDDPRAAAAGLVRTWR